MNITPSYQTDLSTKTIFIFLFFAFNSSILFAQTNVSGVVKNDEGAPVSFANVFFSGSAIGTITDENGNFVLSTDNTYPQLTVSLLGYVTQKLKLRKDRNNVLSVVLKEGEMLDEILVVQKPKKRLRKKQNPAYPILKKIWRKKRDNGLNAYSSLAFQKFTSYEIGIKNLDSAFLKTVLRKDFDSIRASLKQNYSSNAYMPLNLKEQVEQVFISDSLQMKKRVVLAERSTGLESKGFFFDQMERIFQDIDVYKNRILFADKVFESPLSRNGFTTYDYVLLDSLKLANEKLYTLYFFPRRSGDLAFTGSFTVSAPSYAITKINMRIDPKINLNLVSGLDIEKTFQILNDSVYLPNSNRYAGEFSTFKKKEEGKTIAVLKNEFFDEYVFNQPKSKEFFTEKQTRVTRKQFSKKENFWETIEDDKIYSSSTRNILSEINRNKKMMRIVKLTDFITGGYVPIFPGLQFGKWWNAFNNNDVEGNRLRLGFRTFKTMEDRFRSNAYVAYGFLDQKSKYAFDVKYLVKQDPRITIGAVYSDDFEQLGNRLLKTKNLIDFSSGGTNSYLARGTNYYLSDIERLGFIFDVGFTNNLHVGLNVISEHLSSAAPDFFDISSRIDNRIVSSYKNVQLNTYVHYTPRRNVFGYGVE